MCLLILLSHNQEQKMKTPESDKKNQQTCKHCGRIVGCDYRGRKHKCDCSRGDGKWKQKHFAISIGLGVQIYKAITAHYKPHADNLRESHEYIMGYTVGGFGRSPVMDELSAIQTNHTHTHTHYTTSRLSHRWSALFLPGARGGFS